MSERTCLNCNHSTAEDFEKYCKNCLGINQIKWEEKENKTEYKYKHKGIEDCLVITADISLHDKPYLLVTRTMDDFSFKIVNEYWGDEAVELYSKLVGKTSEDN